MVVGQSIGEGVVRARPPVITNKCGQCPDAVLDWEGSVQLRDPAREPTTFAAANVTIHVSS